MRSARHRAKDIVETRDGSFVHLDFPAHGVLGPRRVTVHLPPMYDVAEDQHFPVLFLHDGQNLFRDEDAAFGVEWTVDDTLDMLVAVGLVPPTLAVGISNTIARREEYTPDVDATEGTGGRGDAYVDWIVSHVVPEIRSRFRTLPEREHTGLAGSSLGGLISLHGYMRYPDVFGRIACLSPAFWWNDGSVLRRWENWSGRVPDRLWLDCGSAEVSPRFDQPAREDGLPRMIADVRRARDRALHRGMIPGDSLMSYEVQRAPHNEAAWAERLDTAMLFLLGEERPFRLVPERIRLWAYRERLGHASRSSRSALSVELDFGDGFVVSADNRDVHLESLSPDVVCVDADGTATALSDGLGRIRAEFAGRESTATIIVGDVPRARVRFRVRVPGDTPEGAAIWLSGSCEELGSWAPAGLALLPGKKGGWEGEAELPIGASIEFKVTRGSWGTVERRTGGGDRPNRTHTVTRDTTIEAAVQAWADG